MQETGSDDDNVGNTSRFFETQYLPLSMHKPSLPQQSLVSQAPVNNLAITMQF